MNGAGKVLKYSASAGSGKTHALTGFYLSRVLADPTAYRRILAVTFTNSAAAEMKGRILSELHKLATGRDSEFISYITDNFPEAVIPSPEGVVRLRSNAALALKYILHDYSRFTVGTIDSFFQRVIRAFVRELNIPSGYEIELEHNQILGDAVEELLKEVSDDRHLREWITAYVESRLDDNRSWDVRRDIMEVASQIFREEFRQLTREEKAALGDMDNLKEYTANVFRIRNSFESDLKQMAAKGVGIMAGCGLAVTDLFQGDRGVGRWLIRYSEGEIQEPNTYWQKAVTEGRYLKASPPPALRAAVDSAIATGLDDVVRGITDHFDRRYPLYLAAKAQVKTIHIMGILGSVSEKVRLLAHDENIFLLSDSGELINRLIDDDDTPFIYEKIGAQYDHYIIDEFQDTSRIQWRNFMPLMAESLARGNENLVVGDVKQSIYRWRNSDWRIIHSEVDRAFGDGAVTTRHLDTNYRSRSNVIRFNNRVFSEDNLPALCDGKLGYDGMHLADVYSGAVQKETDSRQGGYAEARFYRKSDDEKWMDSVLSDLPGLVRELQDHGYHAGDIMFLCRKNDEGKRIINRLLEYSATCSAEERARYNFEVTSGESLYLERNPAVSLLISCLRYLIDPASRINLSLMVRCYSLAHEYSDARIYAADMTETIADGILPEGWRDRLGSFRNTSLFAATEKMIQFFGLGGTSANVAYLNSFQDVVLWYSSRYTSDISSFVGWWDREGNRRTVAQSDRQEAMRVMTIHKAKGLQSRVVIIPFASWEFRPPVFSRPLLWIKNVPDSFGHMPVVLPEYSSSLEASVFRDEAGLEKASLWLDGVNMLYVACTRAVDALYIMAPDISGARDPMASVAGLLYSSLKEGYEGASWTESDSRITLTTGSLPPVKHEERELSLRLSEYVVTDRISSMRLKTGGAMPADDRKLTEERGRVYGIVMHELLSRITTADDIEKAVMQMKDEGLVMAGETGAITSKLSSMLSDNRVKSWFDGSSGVRTEATLLLPSGSARRPDRVMISDDRVTVVDYKFGEPEKRHATQAAEYRAILNDMGYSNVEAWLWYIEKDIIEKID